MEQPSSHVLSNELLQSENFLLASVVRPLERLLESGCAIIQEIAVRELLTGLAYPCDDGKHWVASQRLLDGVTELGSSSQLVAAVLACDSRFRQPWLNLMAARCQEASELSDPLQLVERIHQLGAASEWVEASLAKASLSATPYSTIERELLGTQADSISALPILTRVLTTAYQLCLWRGQALPVIAPTALQGQRPDIDWVKGRLLPAPKASVKYNRYLLVSPSSSNASESNQSVSYDQQPFDQQGFDSLPLDAVKKRSDLALDWVLGSPWALLLVAITYEQDIWSSEGLGGLLLELPAGQSGYKPSLVQVLVLNKEGDEVLCGSLAQFVIRILAELSMALFPAAVSTQELDQQLGDVIELLIKRQVWQHRDGISGELDYYQINPQFADACYRMKGQRAFALYGKKLREAIRTQALRWRQEQESLISQAHSTNTSNTSAQFLKDVF
ncbi:hypothetical protein G5Y08_003649 [Vibrio parahaemolyticus]|nr:hypothetical protein [Vibrio parahaemolyticus]EHD2278709.1 hypothetical protein [Vibrio parahaemolyticus]EHH2497990.1 hypothetical protein [Vibrio parahaemolyticus]EHR0874468.1 hypothetical protein [Vibrio parahaemolyticus]EID4326790.1 hypothetical protein [Vibrio parahaemolyticus]